MDQAVVQKLKDYFAARDDISMAFLFGSQAKGTAIAASDTDIAVYFKPEGRRLEWEESKEYVGENKVWSDVSLIAQTETTDLVVLNNAPSMLAFEVITGGISLVIKDHDLYWRFLLMTSDAAQDFVTIADDWMAIRARSLSLNPRDAVRLERLVDFIETNLAELPKFQTVDQAIYTRDRDMRRNLERWVETITTASVDVAKIILASDKKLSLGHSYVEMLRSLFSYPELDEKTSNLLSDFAKTRNLLVHEYFDLRYAEIRRFLDYAQPVYAKLLAFARQKIAESKK